MAITITTIRTAIPTFINVQFLGTLRSAFFEFTQNSVQYLGSKITSVGSRFTSAERRIISAGRSFISAGRSFISAGRIFIFAGCINTSRTGSFISWAARNTSRSKYYF